MFITGLINVNQCTLILKCFSMNISKMKFHSIPMKLLYLFQGLMHNTIVMVTTKEVGKYVF